LAPPISTLGSYISPTSITRLSDTIRAPYTMQTTFAVERTLPLNISAAATYIYSRSEHLLRSRNVNAPLPATTKRPVSGAGEIFQYEASGHSQQNQLVLNLTERLGKHLSFYGTYILSRSFSDTDGPDTFPASSYNLSAEWGRSAQDIRHTFYWGGWITGP